MILGMSLPTFTVLHVVISLIGILAGFIWLVAIGRGRNPPVWTWVFLLATLLTSVTGFMFPLNGVTPAVIFGVISLLVLVPVLYVARAKAFIGPQRLVFVLGGVFVQFLNSVVLIVQSFLKIPALNALAPKGNEPPILVAQILLFILIAWLTVRAVRHFHPLRTPPL